MQRTQFWNEGRQTSERRGEEEEAELDEQLAIVSAASASTESTSPNSQLTANNGEEEGMSARAAYMHLVKGEDCATHTARTIEARAREAGNAHAPYSWRALLTPAVTSPCPPARLVPA
jgi:hypothetical protein